MESQEQSFLYGATTSAHQVEGNNIHNDWWDWEKRTPGIERSGLAADHYNRYKEDFQLARDLGHNAHRLSIEWSRIEPTCGGWNQRAVLHYREVLQELRSLGMRTFVTLHHFTNPLWFAKKGGWKNRQSAELFNNYVRYVARHVGGLVDFWVTINEPMVYVSQSYWQKKWPPQEHSFTSVWRVINNLARAHKRAFHTIHQEMPHANVGIAKQFIARMPWVQNWWFNHRFFQLTPHTHDFIGVNYYIPSDWDKHTGDVSDMNWPIYPEGLTEVLLQAKRYNKPIYVTENGLADAHDSKRGSFIRDHLRAVEKAQDKGADVRGYLYWSLLDNFEWAEGFRPRFGLVEVDYGTMERTIRPSAYVYKAIIEQSQR